MQTKVEKIADALSLVVEAQRDALRGDDDAVGRQIDAAVAVLGEARAEIGTKRRATT